MTLPVIGPPLYGNVQPMYLGLATNMQHLARLPDYGYAISAARSEAIHTLISGGTAITRVPKTKRAWTLPFSGLSEDSANTLLSFYAGSFGVGPFMFVDPAFRNKLGANVSSMGAITQTVTEWGVLNAGTIAWDGTDTAPVPQSDIMTWTGAGNTSKIALGTWSGSAIIPRTADAPPYLSDLPTAAAAGSMYFRTASSTASVSLTCLGITSGGSSLSGAATTATINSTGWTRLTNFAPAASTTMQYVTLQVACNTASAPVIWMSAPDIQFGPTTASQVAAWVLGLGSPRVVVAAGSGGFGINTQLLPYRSHSLVLAEI